MGHDFVDGPERSTAHRLVLGDVARHADGSLAELPEAPEIYHLLGDVPIDAPGGHAVAARVEGLAGAIGEDSDLAVHDCALLSASSSCTLSVRRRFDSRTCLSISRKHSSRSTNHMTMAPIAIPTRR